MSSPPRRNSVDEIKGDAAWAIAVRTEILLNGEPQDKVTEYDCDAGTLERIVTDEAGNIVLTEDRSEVKREILTGEVTVRWKDASHGAA